LAFCMFERLSLIDHFSLDRTKLQNFLVTIEEGYDVTTSYHNRAHAASVLHFTYALLVHGEVADAVNYPDSDRQLILLACLLAAAVHDYEHKGLSNDFLVKTRDERAICYNDCSVNENHHVAAAFAVMQRHDMNFLSELAPAQYRQVRSMMVDLVLGTDVAEGGKLLKDFNTKMDSAQVQSSCAPISAQEATLGLQMMLKCADLGHLALGWEAHLQWVDRLETEFFAQGDREKDLGFSEISFLMDRERPGVSQSQTGFFEFVVLPLFQSLVRAFPGAMPMLEQVGSNYVLWRNAEVARETLTKRATL